MGRFCSSCGQQLQSSAIAAESPADVTVVTNIGWQPPQASLQSQPNATQTNDMDDQAGTVGSHSPSKIKIENPKQDQKRKERRKNKGNKANICGEVRGFQQRTEAMTISVWTFRLERFENGVRQEPVVVEIKGTKLHGAINEGDTIELIDRWKEGKIHRTKRVFNVTAGVQVGIKPWFIKRLFRS